MWSLILATRPSPQDTWESELCKIGKRAKSKARVLFQPRSYAYHHGDKVPGRNDLALGKLSFGFSSRGIQSAMVVKRRVWFSLWWGSRRQCLLTLQQMWGVQGEQAWG